MAKGDALLAGYNVIGHYRFSMFALLPDTLAANARLFSMRNSGSNLLVPTRLSIRAVQGAAGTAQLAQLLAFRCTSFTVSDNTNSAALAAMSVSLRGDVAVAPGNAELKTFNGNVAGMTGGTLTKDAIPFARLPVLVGAAANPYLWQLEIKECSDGAHPIVLAANEGIEIENALLNTTSFGVSMFIEMAWAEVKGYGQ